MTGLRKMRKIGKGLIILSLTWEAAVTLVSLVLILIGVVRSGGVPAADLWIPALGTLGILGVVILAISEARRRNRRQQPEPVATVEDEA